jgi:CheY-like chemotaxis protein
VAELAAGEAESRLRALGGGSVLLAEDNPINQEVACDLLRSVGLAVALAKTGRQAVEMAARNAYDLILMDIQMPEMDGLTAAGMNDHIAKPVDPEKLYRTILAWMPIVPRGTAAHTLERHIDDFAFDLALAALRSWGAARQ